MFFKIESIGTEYSDLFLFSAFWRDIAPKQITMVPNQARYFCMYNFFKVFF